MLDNYKPEKVGIIGKIKTSVFDMQSKRAVDLEIEMQNHIQSQPTYKSVMHELLGPVKNFFPSLLSDYDKMAIALELSKLREKHFIIYKEILAELERLFKVREYEGTNLIVLVGRSVLAQRLAGTTTYTGTINYGLLGDDNTAAAAGNSVLNNEVFRKVVASASYTDHQAFIDFFYSKADTNGTYEEFGTVIDGTGSADTGQLFTHYITGGWTKSASESMTVAVQYDINYQS